MILRTGPASIHHSMTSMSYSEVPKGELLIVILVTHPSVLRRLSMYCYSPSRAVAVHALMLGSYKGIQAMCCTVLARDVHALIQGT